MKPQRNAPSWRPSTRSFACPERQENKARPRGPGFVCHKARYGWTVRAGGSGMGPMLIFFEGELIVRDDLKYPEGVLVVDGRDARGDLLVRPLGGGFQFILPSAEVARFQRVEPAETIEVFSPGTYALEGLDGQFAGWSDGSCWFGWEKPCFSREVAEGIVRATGCRWTCEERTDEFVMANSAGRGFDHFSGEIIELGDGGSATVYFIGAGSWAWDKAQPGMVRR